MVDLKDNTEKNHWLQIKEQSAGDLRLQILLKIYQIFGKNALKVVVFFVTFGIFLFAKPIRHFSKKYLDNVYSYKVKNFDHSFKKPNNFSIFYHIFLFANSLMDRMISWSGKFNFDQLNIKNPQAFNSIMLDLKNNNTPFLISSHLGNIDVLRALSNFYVSDSLNKKIEVHPIIQANHTPKFSNFLRKINPKAAENFTATSSIGIDTVISLKEKLQNGKMIVIAADRTTKKDSNRNIAINFLGKEALFPTGSFTLASLMESPIYFVFCLKAPKEKYDFYFYKSKVDFNCSRNLRKERVTDLMHEYAEILENLCLKYPYQWYNFFDFWESAV